MKWGWHKAQLETLEQSGDLRSIPPPVQQGVVNLSSNDYLGILSREDLREEFLRSPLALSAASSRLLTGGCAEAERLEQRLAREYGRERALLFNSGYHANCGILPALASKRSLIVADREVHASIIDGIRLSGAPFVRFRHNDMGHLSEIVQSKHLDYDRIFIVTEGIFSMGGDRGALREIVEIKSHYENVVIYLDEAHSFGVCGERGLGISEELGLIDEVDIIVGTFGKAISSVGAYVVSDGVVCDYLINTMRPLIYSTSLPPLNIGWSDFIVERLALFAEQRVHLRTISTLLREGVEALGYTTRSESQIVTLTVGDSSAAVALSGRLRAEGFHALAVRPPTVARGCSGVRFSLTANIKQSDIEMLLRKIETNHS